MASDTWLYPRNNLDLAGKKHCLWWNAWFKATCSVPKTFASIICTLQRGEGLLIQSFYSSIFLFFCREDITIFKRSSHPNPPHPTPKCKYVSVPNLQFFNSQFGSRRKKLKLFDSSIASPQSAHSSLATQKMNKSLIKVHSASVEAEKVELGHGWPALSCLAA